MALNIKKLTLRKRAAQKSEAANRSLATHLLTIFVNLVLTRTFPQIVDESSRPLNGAIRPT